MVTVYTKYPTPSLAFFCVLLFGITLFISGLLGWLDQSVSISASDGPRLHFAASFVATPHGPDALVFYMFTIGMMLFGALAIFASARTIWRLLLSSNERRSDEIERLLPVLTALNKNKRSSFELPSWFFWGVIILFLVFLFFAAIKHH